MADPVSLSLATAIMFADGTWVTLTPGTLSAVIDPAFTDPAGQVITPNDTWLQFADDSIPPAVYACPMRSVAAVKLGAPVT